MAIPENELNREKEHLKKVLGVLNDLINEEEERLSIGKDEVLDDKRKIHNAASNGYDDAELSYHLYNTGIRTERLQEREKNVQKLKNAQSDPYMARVDFKEQGKSEPLSIYIGMQGIIGKDGLVIVDWRAPAAALYYEYGRGEASYFTKAGKIEGEVTLKRHFKIEDGEIKRCYDSDVNIENTDLQEILEKDSSAKMTNIVNSIQEEQNEVIRDISSKHLIIQGGAGSGKTSVALHRIAYLKYNSAAVASNNIVMFSPTDAFSYYVSNVLPELGEAKLRTDTFDIFAKKSINDIGDMEDYMNFVNRYYNTDSIDPEEKKLIAYKLSDEFKKYVDSYLESVKKSLHFKKGFRLGGKVFSKEDLNTYLERHNKGSVSDVIENLVEYICSETSYSYDRQGKSFRRQIERLLSVDTDPENAYRLIVENDDFKENALIEGDTLYEGGDVIKFEDSIPLMYLNFELNGYPREKLVKEVVVDEAQDYNLMQIEMIKKAYPNARLTILGDVHQTINPVHKYNSLEEINEVLPDASYKTLKKTYRSSGNVMKWANDIIGEDYSEIVRKDGDHPVVYKDAKGNNLYENLLNDVQNNREKGIKRLAIITKNEKTARLINRRFKKIYDDVSLLTKANDDLDHEIVILPFYLAKGLEFDGVIVYNSPEEAYTREEQNLYYLVCTRAKEALTVYNQRQKELEFDEIKVNEPKIKRKVKKS